MPLSEVDRNEPCLEPSSDDEQTIARVVDRMRPARRILFITGAGLSADSGLPTYRGRDGLYRAENATAHGVSIEEALSGPMLAARPEITWNYLLELEKATRGVVPNRGHRVIAEMDRYFDEVWTITQNVDGLHHRAGSRNVIDIHGDLRNLGCTRCDYGTTVPDYADLPLPPRCPACQGRPPPRGRPLRRATADLQARPVLARIRARVRHRLQRRHEQPVRLHRGPGPAGTDVPGADGRDQPRAHRDHAVRRVQARRGAADVLDRIWDRYLAWWPWA